MTGRWWRGWGMSEMVSALVLAAAGLGTAAQAQGSAVAVPQLDLKQFVGKWYEVARLPEKHEKKCVADAVTLYTLRAKAGQFDVVQSCRLQDGTPNTRNFRGKVANKKSTDGRLKAIYTFPFSHKYWVLGLGEGYSWMLVGSPNHKQLWVLSHTPVLAPEALAAAKAQAASQGFDVGKMVAGSEAGERMQK